ncbi:lysozyme inhibitor LprI family protein [Flavobacterium notoginsengisoli]|uniref:lysozyme inhibitor LprI family protein n=1 Tax=Flavobacterium notoginsengisoli TaxID=1478199 RepID=UPI0036283D31
MKLSFWNWLHLSVPYVIALFCYHNWEENFLAWLFIGCFLTEIITMAPYMDREVKTGRSFNTKYGKIVEYQTVKGESGSDMGNITGKIHMVHFLVLLLIIIYAIYSLFSSINVDKSNTEAIDLLNNNDNKTEINNQINESEIEVIPDANDTLSKAKVSNDNYSSENISEGGNSTEIQTPDNEKNTNNSTYNASEISYNIKSEDELRIADKKLNIIYEQVMAVLNETEKTALRLEQRKWIKHRDISCEEETRDLRGGNLYMGFLNNCKKEATEKRIGELNDILESKE